MNTAFSMMKKLFTTLVLIECSVLLPCSHSSGGRTTAAALLLQHRAHGPRWRMRGDSFATLGTDTMGFELRLRGGGKYARRKARLGVTGEVMVGGGVEKATRRPARGDRDGDEVMSDGDSEVRQGLGKAPKR